MLIVGPENWRKMKKKKNKRKKIKFQLKEFSKKYGFIYIFWKMKINGVIFLFLPTRKIMEIVIRYYDFRKVLNRLETFLDGNSNWDHVGRIYTIYESYATPKNTVFSQKKKKKILGSFVRSEMRPYIAPERVWL